MPLTDPDPEREPIAAREIACRSYRRSDGLWDIEGHLTDVKAYPFSNAFRGRIEAGEPLHDMWLRLTVDADLVICGVEAVTDAGPYEMCPAILPSFQKLTGLKIGPGWNRRVREHLGGVRGCTHLVDLLRPLATVALHSVLWSRSSPANRDDTTEKVAQRPPLNTCHAWASDSEVVRAEFPEHYTGPSVTG